MITRRKAPCRRMGRACFFPARARSGGGRAMRARAPGRSGCWIAATGVAGRSKASAANAAGRCGSRMATASTMSRDATADSIYGSTNSRPRRIGSSLRSRPTRSSFPPFRGTAARPCFAISSTFIAGSRMESQRRRASTSSMPATRWHRRSSGRCSNVQPMSRSPQTVSRWRSSRVAMCG